MRKEVVWIVFFFSIVVVLVLVLLSSNVFVQLGPKQSKDVKSPQAGVDFNGYLAIHGKGIIRQLTDEKTTAEISQYQSDIAQKREFLRSELDKISSSIEVRRVADLVLSVDVINNLPPNKLKQLKNAVASQDIKLSPNWALQSFMQQSIPIVNAEDVWNLNAAGGVCTPVSLSPPQEISETVEISPQCQEALNPLNDIFNTGASPTVRFINDLSKCTNEEIGEFTKGVSGGAESTDPCSESAASDINNDGAVNVLDLIELLLAFGTTDQTADINNDGTVNVLDLLQLLLNWGQVIECECITGKGITIGILDTGVNYEHADFGACTTSEFLDGTCEKFVPFLSWDFYDDDADPYPGPTSSDVHGTHISGTAAGKGDYNNNNVYEPELGEIWGIAPDAKLVAYRIHSTPLGWEANVIMAFERGTDPDGSCDDPDNGEEDCFSDHLDIMSLSFGTYCFGYDEDCGPDDPLSTTVDNTVDIGVVVTIAAGNGDTGPIASPGVARNAITVGASTDNDMIAGFSSWGPVNWVDENGTSQHLDKPDIVAPGKDICSTPYWPNINTCVSGHTEISGTSMSTPHVAGAAALLLQKDPALTPLQVKQILMDSAVDLGYLYRAQGSGRLDVLAAIINISVSNESHGVCLDSSCMIVPGSGIDECVIDADCPTCGDGICEGNEDINNCPTDNCPSHLDCVNQACVPVAGAGNDSCNINEDCTIDSLLVFVSTATTNGFLGSTPEEALVNADIICNEDPQAQSGTYKAWLSTTSENARDRIVDGEYRNVLDQVIANDLNDLLDGSLINSIHTLGSSIWTGTKSDGTATSRCNDWTTGSSGPVGKFGRADETSSLWTVQVAANGCNSVKKLYCFQVS